MRWSYRDAAMEEVLKLVKTYRITPGLADRLHLAEQLFSLIEPDLRLFVSGSVSPSNAEDVLQEVLKAIATSLDKFAGDSAKEFWGWCYGIVRYKLKDQYRRQATDRLQPMPPEELWELVETSAQDTPLSSADRLDLDYAMKLLAAAKPECFDYLWKHFIFGLAYGEIAEEQSLSYDSVRMKVGRCLDEAQSLIA